MTSRRTGMEWIANSTMDDPSDILTAITRRRWVKRFMLATATALTGPRWTGTLLAEATSTGPGAAVIRLKASSIAAISAPGGSVQLVFVESLKPFTLNRVTEDRFVTLDSVCTHNGCTVGRFKENVITVTPPVSGTYMLCPCHGSRYDIEGRVFRDESGVSTEPAPNDLARFATSYDAATDMLGITIPGLALHVAAISVHQRGQGGSVRMKLDFPVTGYARYEIRYQAALTAPLSPVAFATTPGGVANQSVLTPFFDGTASVYVDASGSRGFFVVGLVLESVPS